MGVRFAVLGEVVARLDDRPVSLGPARQVAVLAALLVDVGRPVSTAVLADRVWDGRPPSSATGTLQAYVSRLRSIFASASVASAGNRSPTLRSTPAGYVLDVDAAAVDARCFVDGLARAQALADGGDPAAAREAVGAALALWRGRAYTGVATTFAAVEADRLDDLRLTARELAADLDLELGRHHAVAAELGPVLAEHPFREGLRAALMLALYRSGRQADALRVYRTGRELLADELGVDPGPRLRSLHEAVLRQDADLAGPIPVEPATTVAAAPTAGSPDRFVGRADELASLTAVYRSAAAGSTRFAAVVGEAGIGKSRLTEEAAARARDDGYLVAWGRCWRHEGVPALWPWVQVVRELVRVCSPSTAGVALSGRGGALASMVPELVPSGVTEPGSGGGVERSEIRVFDALAHALRVVSAETPVLIVFDDAQWADPWSRRMFEYTATHARDARLAVVLTVRSPTDEDGDADLAVLDVLTRADRPERVDLVGFTADDLREFVRDRVGRDLDVASAAALRARTDGNPFYAGEVARLVVAQEAAGERSVGVPDGVRSVIRRRLEQLPASDVDVLVVAAVLGRTFDAEFLATVCADDLPDDPGAGGIGTAVDDAVDRATAAGLLRADDPGSTHHRFTHALLQETLLAEAGPSRRRRLHRRVARSLESSTRRDRAARVAHHYLLAGSGPDLRRAVDLLLVAADAAVARWNLPEVDHLLSTATEAAQRLASDAPDTEAMVSAVASRALTFGLIVHGPDASGPCTAVAPGVSGVPIPSPDAPSRDVLTAMRAEWGRWHGVGRVAASELVAAGIAQLAEQRDDDLLRLGAAMTAGYDRNLRGRFRAAADQFTRAESLLAGVDLPPMIFVPQPTVGAPMWRGVALTALGDQAGADELFARARDRCDQLGDPLARAYLAAVELYRWILADQPDRARTAGEIAVRTVDAAGLPILSTLIRGPVAWARSHEDPHRAAADSRAAMVAVDEPDGLAWRPFLRGLHAEVLLRAGDADEALTQVDAALDESARTGAAFWDAGLHRVRADVLSTRGAARGETAAALDRARAVATEQGARLFLEHLDQ